jgi:hypothetical protein
MVVCVFGVILSATRLVITAVSHTRVNEASSPVTICPVSVLRGCYRTVHTPSVWSERSHKHRGYIQNCYFPARKNDFVSNPTNSLSRRRLLGELSVVACAAIAGCASFSDSQTEAQQDARITIAVENPDNTDQDYEIEVSWGENNRSQFSGYLQPAESDAESTVVVLDATGAAPESATFFIGAANSEQTGTWSPTDCPNYRVDAVIEDGEPSFDTTCQA